MNFKQARCDTPKVYSKKNLTQLFFFFYPAFHCIAATTTLKTYTYAQISGKHKENQEQQQQQQYKSRLRVALIPQ